METSTPLAQAAAWTSELPQEMGWYAFCEPDVSYRDLAWRSPCVGIVRIEAAGECYGWPASDGRLRCSGIAAPELLANIKVLWRRLPDDFLCPAIGKPSNGHPAE